MEKIKILTKFWGQIDPHLIDTYRKKGGYGSLKKVLREMKPLEVIEEIKKSGLQGRGGAGFSAGDKWEIASKVPMDTRYFICNLDESEPGAFKDQALAEKNPHQILEGILIGCYAIGAKKAIIYLNGRFKQAQQTLEKAIAQAHERRFLGESIMGFAFDVEIELFMGAGAYICGEESALINSLEGLRGEPRLRPPFPCNCGLDSSPTVVNNAETISNIPWIIKYGAEKFSNVGIKSSPGTKVFSIDGAVKHPGIYEAPIGQSVRDLVFKIAGGMEDGKEFWFAQVGGSSGRIVPAGKLDEVPSFSRDANIPMGSGAILVIDKRQDIKKILLDWIHFFQRESCGKCVPCREGTFRLKLILERLHSGEFNKNDREDIEKILWTLENTTFCPLGKFATIAIRDAMKYKLVKEFLA